LGVRRKEDVFVLDDERFRDGMKEDWKPEDISRVLASAFAPHLNGTSPTTTTDTCLPEKEKEKDKKKSAKTAAPKHSKASSRASTTTPGTPKEPSPQPEGPRATIDVLITFDPHGISSHPNHIALYHGASLFIHKIMRGYSGYACPVSLYVLPTVNIVRKYSFVLDAIPTLLTGIYSSLFGKLLGKKTGGKDERVVFVNDVLRYWRAREAMVSGHQSQMVWFRWGWIGLGRYMVVNDLRRERIVAT